MTDEIIKYNIADESFEIRPDYEQDTVWMTKAEMAHLFGIDRSGVSRHISKAFKNNELNKKSNVQKCTFQIRTDLSNFLIWTRFYTSDIKRILNGLSNSGNGRTAF